MPSKRLYAGRCLALLLLCGNTGAQNSQQPAAIVRVATVETRQVQPVSWMPGVVISRNNALLASELKGRLVWVAEVGERFASGEIVARLDDRDMQLEVEVAKAALQEVKAQLEFYHAEVGRLQQLAERNNTARNRLEEVTAARDELKSRLGASRARLDLAQENLRKKAIKAPFAGVVSERIRHPGEQVPESGAIARLVDLTQLEVSARVPSGGISELTEGDIVRVQYGNVEASGQLRTLVPVGDASRLFEIRIVIHSLNWPVGTPVRVAVPVAASRQALVVPRDALVIRSFGINVFLISTQNLAEMRPVEIGYGELNWVEVIGPLQAGDIVVVRGNERLLPGQAVQVLE